MVRMRITNLIELSDLPLHIRTLIEKDLTLTNPEYTKAVKQGRSTYNKPPTIKLYRYEGETLILPRGYGKKLTRFFNAQNIAYTVDDQRLILPRVELHSRIQTRDYQETAVRKLVKHQQGGVVAPCGAGKTQILLEAMARIGQPALWVTHTRELAEQVIKRATDVLDLEPDEIGRIYGGELTVGKRFTVALVQTLSRINLDEIKDRFGAVLVDEAHHMAAAQFFHPVGQFPARYRLWASATPTRADGLTDMVFAAGGPILYQIGQHEIEQTVTPGLEVIETDFDFIGDSYTSTISAMTEDAARNRLIVNTVKKHAPGHYSLILSERTEHLITLQTVLRHALPDLRIEILHGKLPKKQREAIMQAAINREIDILLATQLAREGLDLPHLDRLFLTLPKRAAAAVQQEVGRVMRPAPGKTSALVIDLWDSQCPLVRGQWWARRSVYQRLGMSVQMGRRKDANAAL